MAAKIEKDKQKKESGLKIDIKGNHALLILVGLLLVFSLIRTFQINEIKESLEENSIGAVTNLASNQQVRQQPSQQQSSSGIGMVGGC